jgi:hypothetical protein
MISEESTMQEKIAHKEPQVGGISGKIESDRVLRTRKPTSILKYTKSSRKE